MENSTLLIIKTESCDEYMFRLNRPLSNKELDIFIQDNLPDEYDFENGEMFISDYKFIDLESIRKINV